MKKKNLIVVAFFAIVVSVSAQSNYEKRVNDNVNSYLENIEDNIKLTSEEKTKMYDLKKIHTENFWKVSKEYKDKPELAEERKKVGVALSESVVEAFGRKRGVEILKAARQKN